MYTLPIIKQIERQKAKKNIFMFSIGFIFTAWIGIEAIQHIWELGTLLLVCSLICIVCVLGNVIAWMQNK